MTKHVDLKTLRNSSQLIGVGAAFLMPLSECPVAFHWCWFSNAEDLCSYLWAVTVFLSDCSCTVLSCHALAATASSDIRICSHVKHFGSALLHWPCWSLWNGHHCLNLKRFFTSEAAFMRCLVLVKQGHSPFSSIYIPTFLKPSAKVAALLGGTDMKERRYLLETLEQSKKIHWAKVRPKAA